MKCYVSPGDRVRLALPYSEVCMHMRVAGKTMDAEVTPARMVQLLSADGSRFSFPITTGEAGIYRDSDGLYFYDPDVEQPRTHQHFYDAELNTHWCVQCNTCTDYCQELNPHDDGLPGRL